MLLGLLKEYAKQVFEIALAVVYTVHITVFAGIHYTLSLDPSPLFKVIVHKNGGWISGNNAVVRNVMLDGAVCPNYTVPSDTDIG